MKTTNIGHRLRRPLRSRRRLPELGRRRSTGQSFLEYIIVLTAAVVVLMIGVGTEKPPVAQLTQAIQDYYTDYTFAMSPSAMPACQQNYPVKAGSVSLGSLGIDVCYSAASPSDWLEFLKSLSFQFDPGYESDAQ